jgi:hypothetical protein
MTSIIDREQLRRDLSDALSAIQRDQDVTGLDALAASLTTLEPACAFHGRLLQKGLGAMPRNYSALIWSLVQAIAKLEENTGPSACR